MAVQITWTRSATRHRISRERSKHVALNPLVTIVEPAPTERPLGDDRLVFLGPDQGGAMLEVMAIETDTGGLLIINAMKIRAKYRHHLPGATR